MRIAAGDWDAVVIAHSTFDLLDDDPDYEIKHMRNLIDELTGALRDAGYASPSDAADDRGKSMTVKQPCLSKFSRC